MAALVTVVAVIVSNLRRPARTWSARL